METNTTNTTVEERSARDAAVTILAIVGFIALIIIGIVLAIYAARYVPSTISRVTNGSSVASTGSENSLAVVPTISFATSTEATSTAVESTTTESETVDTTSSNDSGAANAYTGSTYSEPAGYDTLATTYWRPGTIAYQVPVSYGLPNLTVSILSVGYIDRNGDFIADNTVNQSNQFAAEVLVTNRGTNATGNWSIRTWLPTQNDNIYVHTENFDSLQPGGSIAITLRLNKGRLAIGSDQLKVTVDPNNDIYESNENDNTATYWFSVHK